ncbi:MAG: hypothetical protein FWD66_05280 [Paludibacter sp.]|nr:hypothetical protein [Paludibacter sp.]
MLQVPNKRLFKIKKRGTFTISAPEIFNYPYNRQANPTPINSVSVRLLILAVFEFVEDSSTRIKLTLFF